MEYLALNFLEKKLQSMIKILMLQMQCCKILMIDNTQLLVLNHMIV